MNSVHVYDTFGNVCFFFFRYYDTTSMRLHTFYHLTLCIMGLKKISKKMVCVVCYLKYTFRRRKHLTYPALLYLNVFHFSSFPISRALFTNAIYYYATKGKTIRITKSILDTFMFWCAVIFSSSFSQVKRRRHFSAYFRFRLFWCCYGFSTCVYVQCSIVKFFIFAW